MLPPHQHRFCATMWLFILSYLKVHFVFDAISSKYVLVSVSWLFILSQDSSVQKTKTLLTKKVEALV